MSSFNVWSNNFNFQFCYSQNIIYAGTAIIIDGVLSEIANVIIFISLWTYRQSSSVFYLTIVSIVNIVQLLTGLLSRVFITAVGVDWTETSLGYCKIRNYLFQACAIISPTCLSLATIDQFLATSARPQWQRWSNTKVVHYLSAIDAIFWLAYGILYLIYYNLVVSPTTGISTCIITNPGFDQYYNIVHVPILTCAVPLSLTIKFLDCWLIIIFDNYLIEKYQ